MNNVVKIENQELQVKEYQGKRVVTLKDVDRVHERPKDTARKRFNDNKLHFIEGVDFFSITRKDFAELYEQNNCVRNSDANQKMKGNPNVSMVLLTESGYLMIVKSLTDDLAWKVQRQLVDSYFKVKEEVYETENETDVITSEHKLRAMQIIAGCSKYALPYVIDIGRSFLSGEPLEIIKVEEIKKLQGFTETYIVLNRPTNEVYLNYVDYCKNQDIKPLVIGEFSKQIKKELNCVIVDKRVNGEKRRIFESEE